MKKQIFGCTVTNVRWFPFIRIPDVPAFRVRVFINDYQIILN